MKLPKLKISKLCGSKWNIRIPGCIGKQKYRLLSFFIPFIGLLFIKLICQMSPFGESSSLYSDMYHQYYPFFKTFRATLRSGESLLYNWNVGLGLDHLGVYSYYLASPLNFLSVLVPERWLLGYFSLLVPIKLGLASMFFGIFLEKIFDKQDLSIPLFGSFYGLCAWALGYQWNVMWLDTFALLPLVMLGMVYLLRDKKFILYTITLFLSVYINYYVGLFTCIFVFLAFICYEICRFKSIGRLLGDLIRIAFFSALAIGMTAILSLPTLAALQNTQSSVNKFPKEFYLNMTDQHNWKGLLEAMALAAGNMNGGITYTFKEGLPNLYCGVFATLLMFLSLFCKKIRIRDKVCGILLLLFFNASFVIRQLDYIWHGFHFPNMIPYRFSFLYSFVMLYMAYSAWVHRKDFKLWHIIVATVLTTGLVFLYEDLSKYTLWVYNTVLIAAYAGVLIHYAIQPANSENPEKILVYKKKYTLKRGLCSLLLLGIMAAEIVLNLANFGITFPATDVSNYPKGKESTAAVIDYMQNQEKDDLFYRTEVTHSQTLNDGALNGYYGVSTFTSSANVKVTNFMRSLGYGAMNTYNRYCFEEGSPVSNLFLGLKYMIERDGNVRKNAYFDDIYSVNDVHLLKNNAYLPLGFLVNSQLQTTNFSSDGYRFSFQNTILRKATGIKKNVWRTMYGNNLVITGDCPTLNAQSNTGYTEYITEGDTATITYAYTADREGFMCVNLDLYKRNNFSVKLNGKVLYHESHSLPQMLAVSDVQAGDVVEIVLQCKENEKGYITISAGILNEETFREAYEILAASVLEVTHFSNTCVEGTINCNRDGLLYTSIPQDGNWSAWVDGKPAEIVLFGDVMIGLEMTEGEHTVRFEYHNKAFALGWKVSLGFLAVFVICICIYKPPFRLYRGKYERKN